MFEDPNGDVLYVGQMLTSSAMHILVIKVDADGEELWTKRLEAASTGSGALSILSNGILLSSGDPVVSLSDGNERVVLRISGADGSEVWVKKLVGDGNDGLGGFADLTATADGGFIGLRSFSKQSRKGFDLTKFDANGNVQWYRANAFNTSNSPITSVNAIDMEVSSSGLIGVVCELEEGGATPTFGLFKTDNTGNMTNFAYQYSRPSTVSFSPVSIIDFTSSSFGVLGNYEGVEIGDAELFYLFPNSSGDPLFESLYDCTSGDIRLTAGESDGGAKAVGQFGFDGVLLAVGVTGNMSAYSCGEPGVEEIFYSVSRGNGGRYLLGGNADGDGLLVKTALGDVSECDPEGMTCLAKVANSGMVKTAFPLPHTESPDVSSVTANLSYDDVLEPTNFNRMCFEEGEDRPNKPKFSDGSSGKRAFAGTVDIFPNPAADQVRIVLSESAALRVYDLQGRKVKEKGLSAASNRISVEDLPAGAYLFELRMEGQAPIRRRISINR